MLDNGEDGLKYLLNLAYAGLDWLGTQDPWAAWPDLCPSLVHLLLVG
jgi:hypothetical protein